NRAAPSAPPSKSVTPAPPETEKEGGRVATGPRGAASPAVREKVVSGQWSPLTTNAALIPSSLATFKSYAQTPLRPRPDPLPRRSPPRPVRRPLRRPDAVPFLDLHRRRQRS